MATNVTLPADLLNLQIIDYRTGSALQLTSALRYLRDQSQAARAIFSQQLLPARLADQAPDPGLQGYFAELSGLVAVIVVIGLWDIGRLVLTGRAPGYGGLQVDPVVGLVLILAALTLPLIWQAMGVLAGRARFPGIVIRLIAFMALPVMITAELLGNFPAQGTEPATAQLITGPKSIAAPLLMYVLLCLIIQAPALVTLRDHALGMPRLRPPLKSILYLVAGAAVLILLPSFSK